MTALLSCVLAALLPLADGLAEAVDAYRTERYDRAADLFAVLAEAEADPERAAILHSNAGTAAARDGRSSSIQSAA